MRKWLVGATILGLGLSAWFFAAAVAEAPAAARSSAFGAFRGSSIALAALLVYTWIKRREAGSEALGFWFAALLFFAAAPASSGRFSIAAWRTRWSPNSSAARQRSRSSPKRHSRGPTGS